MVKKRVKNLKKLLNLYIKVLQKSIPVDMVILYGSYARGQPRDWSDIDLIVVSSLFNGGTIDDYLLLSRAARKVTPQIEAIPYKPSDIRGRVKGGFIDEIMKSGKIIYKAS